MNARAPGTLLRRMLAQKKGISGCVLLCRISVSATSHAKPEGGPRLATPSFPSSNGCNRLGTCSRRSTLCSTMQSSAARSWPRFRVPASRIGQRSQKLPAMCPVRVPACAYPNQTLRATWTCSHACSMLMLVLQVRRSHAKAGRPDRSVPSLGEQTLFLQRQWRKLPRRQSLEKSLVCAAAALRTHSIVGAAPLLVQRSIACAYRWHSCRCAGADDSTARSFLRSHNNSVEQAVEAFFQGNTEADSHGVGSRPCL